MVKIVDLPQCRVVETFNIHTGMIIPPIDRMKVMGPDEFEDLLLEWANGYIKNKYIKVSTMAGSGDKGRDIVAYYEERKYDIFQCKHYKNPLSPSNYWLEFGKLCYYTYIGDYEIPRAYYIVSSNGIGQSLRDLIDKPHNINKGLIDKWDEKCKDSIIKNKSIELDGEFKDYVGRFDFSIVSDIPPINLIEQHAKTIWHKFRFGGGIKKREKPKIPTNISEEEFSENYIRELLDVYSQKTKKNIIDIETLRREKKFYNHFERQREDFYCAQSLKRFSRDEYLDEDPFNDISNEVYKGIIDCFDEDYESCYSKVNGVLKVARSLVLQSRELGDINPSDKSGICHNMVNKRKLSWVNEYE